MSKKAERGKIGIEKFNFYKRVHKTIPIEVFKKFHELIDTHYWKSPWSYSYYTEQVDWSNKPDGTYRLADHWNFTTKDGNIHCLTTDSVENDTHWTIAQYDAKVGKYNPILSLPKVTDNHEDKKALANDISDEYLKEYLKKGNEIAKVYKRFKALIPKLRFYVNGKEVTLLKWGPNKIKILEDEKEVTLKFNPLKKCAYIGYYNDKIIIEKKSKDKFKIEL